MSNFSSINFDFGIDDPSQLDITSCFLDTNVIIAFLYQNDERHLACYNFISYLIHNDIEMYISEITISEVINSYARILFIDHELEEYKMAHGSLPSSPRELRGLKSRFKSYWSGHVIKNDHDKLAMFNRLAAEAFAPFNSICYLISSSEPITEKGLELCVEVPLASSDAMIAASAIMSGATALVSLDKDLQIQDYISIFSTGVKNNDYDCEAMIELLELESFLIETLGEVEFSAKFNLAS